MIVEIVVTHEIKEATRLRYEHSGLPVFVCRPRWDSITQLAHTIIADDTVSIAPRRCPGCQRTIVRKERELDHARSWARMALKGLKGLKASATEPATTLLRARRHDKFGYEMYPRVRRAVHQNVHRLQRLGFV
ncbi:hypothetical protein [Candidatus Poriferisodalis sp.]|uniref:hypothetical protein n=1 Tax=Candidatus Poriferisodalis sp. TaxID=3101277 RepID=UPI003B01EEA1